MADDWDKPTVLRKSRPTAKDSRGAAAVNKAMAAGNVEVHKKSRSRRFLPLRSL